MSDISKIIAAIKNNKKSKKQTDSSLSYKLVAAMNKSKVELKKIEELAKLKGDIGERGIVGPEGPMGPMGPCGIAPEHVWIGTKLKFKNPDGTWGKEINLQGLQGIGGGQPKGGGASHFKYLQDVPSTYAGQTGKGVRVKTTEDGLEFYTLSAGSGTVTSVSVVTANGISGSVATSTTTPAITLTLGAITPSAIQVSGLTASEILITDASKNIVSAPVATYPSLTELSYVKGVTSAIQTQLGTKAPTASPTFTGTVILPKTLEIQDTSADHQYVLAVSELTADRTVTLPLLTGADEFVFKDHTQTFTNKRVTKRTGTTTSHATPTINTDNVDFYSLTAQTEAITSFTTNLSGTPTEAQTLWIAITGTAARAITWGASFEASTVALPTTTVTTARLDVGFVWNTVTSKWRCIASV